MTWEMLQLASSRPLADWLDWDGDGDLGQSGSVNSYQFAFVGRKQHDRGTAPAAASESALDRERLRSGTALGFQRKGSEMVRSPTTCAWAPPQEGGM
jgi:hypothetical protein